MNTISNKQLRKIRKLSSTRFFQIAVQPISWNGYRLMKSWWQVMLSGTKYQPGVARRLDWVFFFFLILAPSPGCGNASAYNNPELLYVCTVGASQWCGSRPKQRESVRVVQYRLTWEGHYVSHQGKWEALYIPECDHVLFMHCCTSTV